MAGKSTKDTSESEPTISPASGQHSYEDTLHVDIVTDGDNDIA